MVRTPAMWSEQVPGVTEDDLTSIEVPIALKRCGMAVRLIVRAEDVDKRRAPDPKLVALIAKAHDWFDRLSLGRSNGVGAISRDEQVTTSYVTRVI